MLAEPNYVRRFISDVDRSKVLTAADVLVPVRDWTDSIPDVTVASDHTLSQIAGRLGRSRGAAVTERGAVVGYVSTESVLSAVATYDKDAA